MGDYKVAIKIAGQLEGSFNRTLKMAQSGIGGLAKIGKIGATAMAASAAAMGTLAAAGIKAGVEYEQAFAGVRKTVDATEAELQALSQGIRDMAKEMPTSASEIAGVAEAAGQLGIQTENILGFTKTMVMLGDATNMSADEAATSLARLANITGMPQSSFDRLGSTIVALGNNFATTESEITAMGLRIAGAGSQVGMTEAQIMSFSAALSSVGIEAEAGGSAFSKVLVDMQLATEKGGESLQQFANVAGMSASQFKQAFQTDAAGAMASFIKGLSESEAKGKSAIAVLDEMGITEVRMRDMLLRAAGASDTFTEALELGSAAWEENVALTNEANQRYKTMGSRLAILKNKAIDLGIAFYESVNTPMGDVVTAAGDMLENLNAAFESGGMSGLVNQLGTEIANAVTGIADAAPDMIDAAVDLMESFLAGIEQNQDKITSGLERTAVAAASGLIRITPQLVVVGAEFIVALAQGLVENAPQLAQAGREAVSYLMNAAKDAFKEYVDFLGDDQVKPFEKILALIPAVAAGFGAFKVISTIAKDVTAFTNAIKGVGKATPAAKKGVGGVNSVMSATAKNILGAGVGLGMAAAGFWLLADAAIRLGEAGPMAAIEMAVMAAGIAERTHCIRGSHSHGSSRNVTDGIFRHATGGSRPDGTGWSGTYGGRHCRSACSRRDNGNNPCNSDTGSARIWRGDPYGGSRHGITDHRSHATVLRRNRSNPNPYRDGCRLNGIHGSGGTPRTHAHISGYRTGGIRGRSASGSDRNAPHDTGSHTTGGGRPDSTDCNGITGSGHSCIRSGRRTSRTVTPCRSGGVGSIRSSLGSCRGGDDGGKYGSDYGSRSTDTYSSGTSTTGNTRNDRSSSHHGTGGIYDIVRSRGTARRGRSCSSSHRVYSIGSGGIGGKRGICSPRS